MATKSDGCRVRDHRTVYIAGYPLRAGKNREGYSAVFGPDYCVRFTKPTSVWVARLYMGKEPIGTGLTLRQCVDQALSHYNALQAETRARVAARLGAL
jgi:hypothetical protein